MKEWKTYKLGDIVNFTTGKLDSNAADINGKYPFFTCSPETLKINSFAFNQKAILLAGNNAEGNFSVKYYEGKFNAYQRTYVISISDENVVDYKFLYYALKICLLRFKMMSQGTSTKFLTKSILNSFEIDLPNIETQQSIASILASIDSKIQINRQINDNLEQQAQALYKSWFIDFEPFKDGKFEESEIGLIPEGWHVGKAGDFYEINIGKTPPRKEHEWFTLDKSQNIWISISDLGSDGRFLFNSSEYLTDKAIQKHNIVLVPEDTVLLSFKLTIGRVGIAGTQLTTNEAIARFITNSINREYTYFLLKNFNYSKLGSTSSIATAVNSKIIKAMIVLMPSNECLLNFKKLVGPIIDGIKKNEEEILRLTALRDNLLPKLMSGELKINEIDC